MASKSETKVPEITEKSTKKEMLDAIEYLKKAHESRMSAELNPEKVKEERRKDEVVKTAEAEVSGGIDGKIKDLQLTFSKELAGLGEKLKAEGAKYAELKEAVAFKEAELKEIYEIERGASSLAALIEAQKRKKEEFETEMERRREDTEKELEATEAKLRGEIATTSSSWEQQKRDHDVALKEQKAVEEKERTRRKEEFEYNFQRECQQRKDKIADELSKTEKEMALRKDAFEKQVAAKEAELKVREEKVAQRERLIDELQKQVDVFPKQLEAKVTQAVKEVTDRLTTLAVSSEKLLRAELAGEKNVLMAKIEALESVVKSHEKQNSTLYAKLESAYGNVQDIAVKAVDSSAKQMKNITVQSAAAGKDEGKSRDRD